MLIDSEEKHRLVYKHAFPQSNYI
ncbi:TPA: hypothetical protein QCP51_005875 [Bacillus cereus]|nr:hypothetical protein [Bacillus cereus]HDR6957964.1 hypothetical protein [Bacillus cereus]